MKGVSRWSDYIRALHRNGHSAKRIAEFMGFDEGEIKRVLKMNVEVKPDIGKGSESEND